MYSALVGARALTLSGVSFVNLLILIALVAIGWPLLRKVRRSASENRKRRWVEEGLMDLPATGPEGKDPSDQG